MDTLDLSRTRAAVAAFDAYQATNPILAAETNEQVLAAVAEEERLAEAVGVAFGLDTADRNNQETCRRCVRPGDPWLRNLLAKYGGEVQVGPAGA